MEILYQKEWEKEYAESKKYQLSENQLKTRYRHILWLLAICAFVQLSTMVVGSKIGERGRLCEELFLLCSVTECGILLFAAMPKKLTKDYLIPSVFAFLGLICLVSSTTQSIMVWAKEPSQETKSVIYLH